MPFSITWKSDYKRWRRTQTFVRRLKQSWVAFATNYLLLPALAAGYGIVIISRLLNHREVGSSGYWFFIFLGASVGGYIGIERTYKKMYRESWSHANPDRICNLTFSENGVDSSTPGVGSAHFDWPAFSDTVRNDEVIALFLSTSRFLIVPRDLLSAENAAELDSLLLNNLSRAR